MAPKRIKTTRSSSILAYFYEYFSSLEKENRFNGDYAIKKILPSYLDVNVIQGCEFFKMSEEANLKSFISEALWENYPTFVRMFLSNLKYTNGIITSEV